MTANIPVTVATQPHLTDCNVASMPQQELTDHRRRVGATVEVMMKAGAYFDKGEAESLETAVLRDWIDRLQDWTPEAIRKAFWAWQDQNPNRRPNAAHILHILRDRHGRNVIAQRQAKPVQIETPEPPKRRVSPERAAAIMAEIGARFQSNRQS